MAVVVEKVNVETPDPPAERPTGLTVNEMPAPVAEAGTVAERVTLPVSPLLLRDTVETIELPATNADGLIGEALIEKSA